MLQGPISWLRLHTQDGGHIVKCWPDVTHTVVVRTSQGALWMLKAQTYWQYELLLVFNGILQHLFVQAKWNCHVALGKSARVLV
jgi:hypothetical protein